MKHLPPLTEMRKDQEFWFGLVFRTGTQRIQAKLRTDDGKLRFGRSATQSGLHLAETMDKKELLLEIRLDGVTAQVVRQKFSIVKVEDDTQPKPKGRRRKAHGVASKAEPVKAPGNGKKKGVRGFKPEESSDRKAVIQELVSDQRIPGRFKTCFGADPNRTQLEVATALLWPEVALKILSGQDNFAAANAYLSDVDTEICEHVADGKVVRHVILRETPKREDSDRLSMGRIIGFRHIHMCDTTAKHGIGYRCEHWNQCATPGAGPPPPAVPLHPREPVPPDKGPRVLSRSEQAQRDARREFLMPTPTEPSLPADFWTRTGLLNGTSGDQLGRFELVRRVSSDVYRRKSNIIRNSKALERHLKSSMIGDKSAAEWQSNIPSSNVTTLAAYLTYTNYVLKDLCKILDVYADIRHR